MSKMIAKANKQLKHRILKYFVRWLLPWRGHTSVQLVDTGLASVLSWNRSPHVDRFSASDTAASDVLLSYPFQFHNAPGRQSALDLTKNSRYAIFVPPNYSGCCPACWSRPPSSQWCCLCVLCSGSQGQWEWAGRAEFMISFCQFHES